MVDLQKSRDEIDKVDRQIVELFEYRMKIAKDVAEYKISTGKKVFDKKREEEKLAALMSMADNDFNRFGIKELFTQIMSMSRKLQYGIVESDSIPSFEISDKLDISKSTRVVYFGVRGTYTEQAMEDYFGTEIDSFNEATFKGVMEAIKEERADYGVLPIENSSTGGITDIYDLLVEFDNYIVGEHVVKVDHALLGLEGSSIENIRKVYSHPQPIMQCSKFLDEHKYIKPYEYLSTAASALKILEDKDVTQAAIASKRAAEYYGLKILQEEINSDITNSTRFIIITNKKICLSKANKVSVCFELPHESGSLYNMLSHIIYNGLNMSKIESRPLEGKKWEYRFFVDFEGNLMESGVKNALNGIKQEAINMKILGNFLTE